MHTRNLLWASLLVALYGCQPETPAQQAPAAAVPLEAPVAMVAAPESAPAQAAEPVTAESNAPAMQEKSAAMKEPVVAQAAKPAVAAIPAKVEPAPVAESKPETKVALSEADALALAKKNGCLVCHSIDKKLVGPAWKDVAAKYRGDAGAEARMMDKIAKGGAGVWGSIAMPPSPKIGEADRQALARFVLSLQ